MSLEELCELNYINYVIPSMVVGIDFVFMIDNNQNVYSFGSNKFGKLGRCDKKYIESPVKQIKSLINIKSICCGRQHSICLNFEGEVFTFGINKNGKLGIGNINIKHTHIPQKLNLPFIVQISSGDYFSLCLSDEGNVYSFGSKSYGELGLGETSSVFSPHKIPNLDNIDYIICSGYNSICKTVDGIFYSWGDNEEFQLGNGTDVNRCTVPTLCENWPKNIKSIKCGYTHTLLLTTDGKVYSFGNNKFGQLGFNNKDIPKLNIPTLINKLPEIEEIECGYENSMCIDYDRNLWVFGYNSYGQLGTGNLTNITSPIKHPTLSNISQISSGGFTTFVKINNEEIYAFGSNLSLELGIKTKKTKVSKPMKLFKGKEYLWATCQRKCRQKSARKIV